MQPRAKFLLLIFLWLAPYFGFIFFVSGKIENGRIPMPYVYAMAAYFFGGFALFSVLRLFRVLPSPGPEKTPTQNLSQAYGARLVIFWSALFLYGLFETLTGAIAWQRAIPAGILLLAFILLFGWNILRLRRS